MQIGHYIEVTINNQLLRFQVSLINNDKKVQVTDPGNGSIHTVIKTGDKWKMGEFVVTNIRPPHPNENESSYWTDPRYAGTAEDEEQEGKKPRKAEPDQEISFLESGHHFGIIKHI